MMRTLLAYDGRQQRVLDYAIDHALAYKSTLFIISALATKNATEIDAGLPKLKGSLEAAKQRALDKGVDVHIMTGAGDPATEIVAAAERIGADTIIVGHRDKTVLDRVVLGSISENVLRNARCTVIFVL
ncbi:universal stress protein [Candidatus Methanoplasma termitum]|nr:universal stress protein [Candidatus Methanoplasma termitum]MCL2333981.1 universal stress protein [Candidatus Methanoplasma sp.]